MLNKCTVHFTTVHSTLHCFFLHFCIMLSHYSLCNDNKVESNLIYKSYLLLSLSNPA